MFTLKIVQEDEGNTILKSWDTVRVHGPFSDQFSILVQDELDRTEEPELKEAIESYYSYLTDGNGNEYWLVIGEDCYITDMSGKTVQAIRSPQPINQ